MYAKQVYDGIWGLIVGDALGVPVEFVPRAELTKHPVVGMRAHGTHNQPAGTWSDDSSMTLCTLEWLVDGLDYDRLMHLFLRWAEEAHLTAHDEVFDMGVATRNALARYGKGTPALSCGGTLQFDNGNGSLMRILPLAFYLNWRFGDSFSRDPMAFDVVHNVSRLTHAHPISLISCGIYCSIAGELLNGKGILSAMCVGIDNAKEYYAKTKPFDGYLWQFERVDVDILSSAGADAIKSGGFVLDTLEAALWCLLRTTSYRDCLLTAVNLGEDTDTVGAVAGGLAGLAYGKDAIPPEWIERIARAEQIDALCADYIASAGLPVPA